MLVIGLTGGIGSGKSTVADYFKSLGVPVIDADVITRELVKPGQDALQDIAKYFGNEIIQADGQLDRARLRKRVFSNPEERIALENILHPRAREITQQRIAELDTPYCIVCAPLLIESGWTDMVQRVLVIDLPVELQVKRTIDRDGITPEQAESIIKSQLNRSARLAAADDILDNSGDITSLLERVDALHKQYLLLSQSEVQA